MRPSLSAATPGGWHSVTPRLVVHDPAQLVAFLKEAFGAEGEMQTERPSEIWIADSVVMVSAVGQREAMQSFLYLYLEDTDATCARAIRIGAVSIEAPLDTSYGDRRAMIVDPAGNIWQTATRKTLR
jgi:PhnB protein